VFLGVACGSSGSAKSFGPGDASKDSSMMDASPLITATCANVAMAECAKLETCSPLLMQTRYGSVSTCQTRLSATCANALDAPSTGNSPAQLDACLKVYGTWSCTDYIDNVNAPAACAQQKGKLASGAACAFPAQCETGFCAIRPHAVCGTCADAPKVGDSCADLTTCGEGLLCIASSKSCATLGTVGETCDADSPCGAHLSCIGANAAKATVGKCQTSVAKKGATCDPTNQTGPGCDFDAGFVCNSMSKECEPITVSPAGGPCDSDDHQFAVCSASGSCSASEAGALGTCTAAAVDGKACTTAAKGPGCLVPARCILTTDGGTTGTCQVEETPMCK
jgi:hypothetical protein